MEGYWDFLSSLAPVMTQFFLAIVGGGIVSAFLTERWARRRERYSILIGHVALLIRCYHTYVRSLNRIHSERSSHELDQAHAAFYAEAKLLGLSPMLERESADLIALADEFYRVRKNASEDKAFIETELQPIFTDFAKILDLIQNKFRNKGAL